MGLSGAPYLCRILNLVEHMWDYLGPPFTSYRSDKLDLSQLGRKCFYLMTHSTHFSLRLYGVRHIVKVSQLDAALHHGWQKILTTYGERDEKKC